MQTNLTIANDNYPVSQSSIGNSHLKNHLTGDIPHPQTSLIHAPSHAPVHTPVHGKLQERLQQSSQQSAGKSSGFIHVSEYSPVKPGVRIHLPKVPTPVTTQTAAHQTQKIKRQKTGRFPVYVLLLLWFLAVAAIARFAGSPNDATLFGTNLAIAGGALGVLSLALASLARRRRAKLSHSIGIASACVCLAGLVWFYLQQTGIKISPEFMALGVATASLIFARIWKTPFLLHISLLVMVGWSTYSFMNYQVSELAWLFPALWSVQMFLALEFRIKRSIFLSIFTGILWIGVNLFLLEQGNLM